MNGPGRFAEAEELEEQREELFGELAYHLAEAGSFSHLLEHLESSSYLAEQADYFEGFTVTAENLETYVLAAAIQVGDWPSFLRFGAVAQNLRGVANDLADEEMVVALARGGRFDLASDAADRIADTWFRAQAWSALAALADGEQNEDLGSLLTGTRAQLDTPGSAPYDPELALSTLRIVARHLGRIVGFDWAGWIERYAQAPSAAESVRRALAEAWLDLGQPNRDELWQALANLRNLPGVLDFAPRRLGELAMPAAVPRLLGRLEGLFAEDAGLGSRATARFFAALSERHPKEASNLWLARADANLEWTAELADDLQPLLPHLPTERLTEYAANAATPEARAALRTAVLTAKPKPGPEATEAAVAAVHAITDPAARLHRALRFLKARPRTPDGAAKNQLLAVAGHLDELQFEAATEDLIRFVDLAAELASEKDLGVFLDGIAWAPSADGVRLLEIARKAKQDPVLALLADRAERYAAAVSKTQAEGFTLRGQLRGAATVRRCLLLQCLKPLAPAVELLLPDEEDELRFELARALARLGRADLALEVGVDIRDRRRRLLARLEAEAVAKDQPEIRARDLYAALARVEPLTDEARGLGLLFEPPFDPVEVADRRLAEISERPAEVRALLRLAEHSLAFQQRFRPRMRDLLAPLELLRARIGFENDSELAAATPDVALIAARLNPKRADLELGEAARRLLGLETISWDERLAAFSRLVGIARLLATEPEFTKPVQRALAAMARLPNEIEPKTLRAELGVRWPEVAPHFTAKIQREPEATSEAEWLDALAQRIGQGEIDPNSTALSPILHRLWTCDEDESRPRLAKAVLEALKTGGRAGGEAALRLFLHAHLAPRLGSDRPDKEEDLSQALAAFESALSLAPATGTPLREEAK